MYYSMIRKHLAAAEIGSAMEHRYAYLCFFRHFLCSYAHRLETRVLDRLLES